MNCPFCNRSSECRHLKDGKVRCMGCGWKWENGFSKPHIEKRSTGWGVIFAPQLHELNDEALQFANDLNSKLERSFSWSFVFSKPYTRKKNA